MKTIIKLSNAETLVLDQNHSYISPDPKTLDADPEWHGNVDGFLSLALALHCDGLDLSKYESAVQTAWEAISQ